MNPHQSRRAKTRIQTVGADPPVRSWRVWAAAGFLAVAVIVAYANSFHGPFVLDDTCAIVGNPSIRHLGSLQVLAAPSEAVTTPGRPVANLSLAINYAIGGLKVEGYHAVNLAIHILAALALFGLVRRTLLLPTLSARFAAASTDLALTVALLWALHPLQTESVTYVVQRVEAMVGLFYLLTLYCLLRGATATHGWGWYAAALGACALGMGTKEVMVSAPLVALLYDRIFIAGSLQEALRQRRRWYLALAATWAILGLLVYVSLGRSGSAGFGLGMTTWEYARTQFGCIIHYLRLTFWPTQLVLDYGTPIAHTAAEIVPYALGVFLLVAATVVALLRQPRWGFLGVWFFAILAPTSSIVPLVGQTKAEHRMYLPLAAVVALVVLATYRAAGRVGPSFWRVAVALILAVALGWETHQRNAVYQSELSLWDDNVRKSPNFRAYNNRGNAYLAKGQYDEAIKDFDRSIALHRNYSKAYDNRGNANAAKGQYDQAIKDYDKAVKANANYAEAYNDRGSAYATRGQVDLAIKDFNKAIELKPDLEEAYNNRGGANAAKGQYDQAIKDYDKAIALNPDYTEAYNNRGRAHDGQGQVDVAIKDYSMAVEHKPDFAEAYSNRSNAYLAKGQYDAAIKDCDKAIGLKPDSAEAYSNRGNAYQGKGQYDAAIRDYDKAIELKPDLADAYNNRAVAHCQTKAYDKAWADVKTFRSLGRAPSPELLDELTKSSGRSE
jgi:protein O-mannosyl-transferase